MATNETNTASLAGTRFGRFEVEARIATGGMAEVWRARLTGTAGFEKRVALKTLLPEFASRDGVVKMFIHEAALAARLNHANVVQVFDFGCIDGRYFMAMEYIHGRTLRELLQLTLRTSATHLPMWALLDVGLSVADGLSHIHEFCDEAGRALGLVHRDVSPENIMISWNGAVKLIDFGLARVVAATSQAKTSVVGKPRYMAPEQALGQHVDARADVFSLGVVLYACACGRHTVSGADAKAVLDAVVRGDYMAVEQVNPSLHPDLAAAITRALATQREARTPSAAVLRSELMQWGQSVGLDPTSHGIGRLMAALDLSAADVPLGLRNHAETLDLRELLRDGTRGGTRSSSASRSKSLTQSYPSLGAWVSPTAMPPRADSSSNPWTPRPGAGSRPALDEPAPPPLPPLPTPLQTHFGRSPSATPSATDHTPPPFPVRTESQSGDELPPRAEALFELGLAAYRKHRWSDAVAAWTEACAIVPGNRGWAFNLVRARERLAEAEARE